MYDPNSWTSARGRVARLVRLGAPEADIIEARRNMRALKLAEHVTKVLAGDPPLSDEQCQRLADLLVGGAP